MTAIQPIWQPKFSTQEVLVNVNAVRPEKCFVMFIGDKNHPNLYSYNGEKVRRECRVQKNGRGQVFCVPLSWLEDEGELPKELKEQRKKDYPLWKERFTKKKSSKK